jgi:hypothetical protein
MWLFSGLLRTVVWWKFTDVSDILAASIVMAMNNQGSTSEMFVNC